MLREEGLRKTLAPTGLPPEFEADLPVQQMPVLRLVANLADSSDKGKAIFGLVEFFYEGKPQEVERMLELSTRLFNRQLLTDTA